MSSQQSIKMIPINLFSAPDSFVFAHFSRKKIVVVGHLERVLLRKFQILPKNLRCFICLREDSIFLPSALTDNIKKKNTLKCLFLIKIRSANKPIYFKNLCDKYNFVFGNPDNSLDPQGRIGIFKDDF